MKKKYIKPINSTYKIELTNIVAASTQEPGLDNSGDGNVGGGEEGGRNDNPSSPNIWDQKW